MLCRCVVALLVFHLLVKETSAFVLPKGPRVKREASLLNPDFPHEEVNPGDLSPGDDPWDLEGRRRTHAGIVLLPRLDLPQSHRRDQEKGRKLAPMDSIGSSLMSGHRNRKEASSNHWEEYS